MCRECGDLGRRGAGLGAGRRDAIVQRLIADGDHHRVVETDHYPWNVGVTRAAP